MSALRVLAFGSMALALVWSCKESDDDDDGSGGSGGQGNASERCESLCQAFSTSGCDNAPTQSSCMVTCLALTSSPACNSSAHDYFDCVDATTINCDAAGDPYASGCGGEWLVAIDCATTENPNPAIEGPCGTYCDKVEATACPYNGTRDACYTNCLWLGATGTGCDDEWGGYLTCANGVTMECVLGFAVAPGCGDDWTAYWDCINAL
jgi:hypothetical protein